MSADPDVGAASVLPQPGVTAVVTTATPPQGLTAAEVAARVADGRTNDAPDPRSRSLSSIIRTNTFTIFNLVIGTLWILMLIAAPIQDSLFGFIIIINTGIGIVQEYRAKRTLERLSLVGEARPVVRRDGVEVEVRPTEVVLDDIIVLRSGDQLVVDGEIVQENGLEIDESLLTGEADPVEKGLGAQAMSGSFVAAGSGAMRATKVGRDSYAAQVTEQARKFSTTRSELRDSIMKFVRTITWVLLPVGVFLFWSQLRNSPDWQDALRGTVAGVVTMVPEGLVLLTSVAMAVAVVRLGQKKALVQDMPAVEVLARVDVVCVDKTGTLTQPGMHVRETVILDASAPTAEALGALGAAESSPNPTVAAVAESCPDPGWALVSTVPFSSARKWSAATFEGHGAWVFGAPEMLLPADHPARPVADERSAGGARVLLLARSTGTPDQAPSADTGAGPIEAVALVVIDQKLRDDAAATVAYFLDQGVTVKVISGDNPLTVGAIAGQAGIPGGQTAYDARHLPEDVDALADVLEEHNVYGRVTPAQKRAMVGALQSRGHVVAMTGDGVNDVLALKDADLGIAMGSGAGATRAVAQIVLLDNKFSVMPSVVAEGRRVLGNIERVSDLFITKSFYALVLAVLTVLQGVEFLFLPRQLTVISALTIGTPAFFIALMPNTARFRPGFFRRVVSFAVPAGVVCAVGSMVTYRWVLSQGISVADAQTAAAITLFIIAWFVLLIAARPFDLIRLVIVVAMGLGFVLCLAIPWFSRTFSLNWQPDTDGWIAVGVGAVGALVLLCLTRFIDRARAQAGAPIAQPAS